MHDPIIPFVEYQNGQLPHWASGFAGGIPTESAGLAARFKPGPPAWSLPRSPP